MSMPIQRQSEAYGIFDDGPRFARDRSSHDLPAGLAGLINSTGPRIQAGLLNTRQAGRPTSDSPYGWDYNDGPESDREADEAEAYERMVNRHEPDDRYIQGGLNTRTAINFGRGPTDHGGAGPDGGPAVPDWYWDDDEADQESDEEEAYLDHLDAHDPDRFLPGDHVAYRQASRRPFDRAAVARLAAEHRIEDFAGSGRPVTNPYTGDDEGDFDGDPEGRGHWSKHTAAPAPTDPAMAPQMPVGGGFMPAHRVGLDWRDSTVPGTVIGVDDQVHVRWDDGQYTSENPAEVHLL